MPDVDEQDYLRVIRYKTAKLFEAAARLGAILGQRQPARWRRPWRATACTWAPRSSWSTTCSTIPATMAQTGKNLGDDLAEGKPTLPLIYAMQHGSRRAGGAHPQRDRAAAGWTISAPCSPRSRKPARSTTRAARPKRETRSRAIAALRVAAAFKYRDCLLQLADFAVTRNY